MSCPPHLVRVAKFSAFSTFYPTKPRHIRPKIYQNNFCIAGEALPYGASTYAWELRSPIRYGAPVPYAHKRGVVVWAIMD